MKKAKDLKEGDRITLTGFPRHNATVMRVIPSESAIKLELMMSFIKNDEGNKTNTVICNKNRQFKDAVVVALEED